VDIQIHRVPTRSGGYRAGDRGEIPSGFRNSALLETIGK